MAGTHIWISRTHMLSRSEFTEETKPSSALKIAIDFLTSMKSRVPYNILKVGCTQEISPCVQIFLNPPLSYHVG